MADGILAELGIRLQDVIAGMAGGVVNAFVFKRSDPYSIVGSVVVGTLTAAYLADPASHLIGKFLGTAEGTSGGGAAFIVGLAGMAICQGIIEAAKSWRPFNGRSPDGNRPQP